MNTKSKQRRQIRIRAKIKQVSDRFRLTVFRSNKYIYGQIIDDQKGTTLVCVTEKEVKTDKMNKIDKAKEVGKILAGKAIKEKIGKVTFDKGPNKYHGRVKAFADGAREGGLEF